MAAIVITPLPGVGIHRRLFAWLRRLLSRRLLLRLAGIPTVILEGKVLAVRPVPIAAARHLVPAIIRCARSFSAWEINEALYDDFVVVLSYGLGISPQAVEKLTIPLWQLAPVVEQIAQVNGLPTVEAGRSDLGKFLGAMNPSTGTPSSPGSSPAPDGHGSTLSNA